MIPMTPDDDVRPPQRGGRRLKPEVQVSVDRFAKYKPGQSFFVANAKLKDVDFLRRVFKRAGLGCTFRTIEKDEIYQLPGVRVWREKGTYDEDDEI